MALVESMKGSSTSPIISRLEFSVFSHATEDESKVERAIMNLVQEEVVKIDFRAQKLGGYYGDPLVLMSVQITNRKDAAELFCSLVRSLSALDRRRLCDEAGDRVDETGNLYIRFDKQKAFGGKVALNEADPIRMRCKFRIPHGADVACAVRVFIMSVLDEFHNKSEAKAFRREDA